jgi:PAS domain S-box-containing protein
MSEPSSSRTGPAAAEDAEGDPFAGAGEVRAIGRSIDWGSTSLGPVADWPAELRTVVRAALDSPFPINLWCGPDLVLIYNDAYRHVLGAKHPAALGRPGSVVWSEIWDEIHPLFDRIRAGGPAVYAHDAPFVVERAGDGARPAANGPNAWFTFALSPVRGEAGEIIAFLNIVSESTGRILAEREHEVARARAERAEARLLEVFSRAPAFLAVLRGADHVVEYANDAYYQLVGHRELIGRPVFDVLDDARGQGFEKLLDDVLATGEPFIGREVPLLLARGPDGDREERFVDLVYYPITEADGTRSGVVAHGSDVTEHVLARREAQRARVQAEQANRAKSQFLANMSHEIRTPINAVIGYADLLDAGVGGPLAGAQLDFVQRIRTSSRHLLGLVNDVLDMSRIEVGEMRVRAREVAVRGVVASALDMVAPQAARDGVELRPACAVEESLLFLGDEDRVRQILLNLLSNALKFTPSGGVVSCACRVEADAPAEAAPAGEGPWIVVDIEDTGTGIPAEHLSRIFEPFRQVDGGHTRTAGGTGLGLTISRRFARLMGGDLTVRSSPGAGSCFSLWLPRAADGRASFQDRYAAASDLQAPADDASLIAVGSVLVEGADRIEKEFVRRLRADDRFHTVADLDPARLGGHTAAVIALVGRLITFTESSGWAAALRKDAEDAHTLLARRHGAQRRRLGWSPVDVDREYRLLHQLVDAYIRRYATRRTAADIADARAAVHAILDRARTLSVEASAAE